MTGTTVSGSWVTGGVIGIVLATFFSDVGMKMATATLPMYLASIGLGAAALGVMEGFADLRVVGCGSNGSSITPHCLCGNHGLRVSRQKLSPILKFFAVPATTLESTL